MGIFIAIGILIVLAGFFGLLAIGSFARFFSGRSNEE
nr:MAG TPA: protein of unknown function (DUF4006) [Caudoviricetes sp.]